MWWSKYHSSDCFLSCSIAFLSFCPVRQSSNYALKGCLPMACALPIKGGLRRVLMAALNSKVLYHRPRELSTSGSAHSASPKKKKPRSWRGLFGKAHPWTAGTQTRESSDKPILNAFCRVAPSERFSVLAIRAACVFFRASAFNVRICSGVHARRFVAFLAIKQTPDF